LDQIRGSALPYVGSAVRLPAVGLRRLLGRVRRRDRALGPASGEEGVDDRHDAIAGDEVRDVVAYETPNTST
jgi:hypothetical protein